MYVLYNSMSQLTKTRKVQLIPEITKFNSLYHNEMHDSRRYHLTSKAITAVQNNKKNEPSLASLDSQIAVIRYVDSHSILEKCFSILKHSERQNPTLLYLFIRPFVNVHACEFFFVYREWLHLLRFLYDRLVYLLYVSVMSLCCRLEMLFDAVVYNI